MKNFDSLLLTAMDRKQYVSIHTDKADGAAVDCGCIDGVDDVYVRLNKYTEYGYYDGMCVLDKRRIIMIDKNGPYEDRIAYLSAAFDTTDLTLMLPHIQSTNILMEALLQVQQIKAVATIWILEENHSIRGVVQGVDDQLATISMYDGYGAPEGSATISIDEICRLNVDSRVERRITFLIEHQQEFLEFRKQQIR
jgi:hypothetical protein